ncbi:MAG: tetratricopeptide repeat protein [Bacteroidales bacterium]|nr:tetratricopeptide repeat protein [Bacteroidales bacterium]
MNTSSLNINIKTLLAFFLINTTIFSAGSQNVIDSLQSIVNNASIDLLYPDNKDLLKSYDSIIRFYRKTENYDSLIVYENKVAQLYLRQNNLKKYVKKTNEVGYYYTLKGEHDESVKILLDNLRFAKENNLNNELAETYMYLGFGYRNFNKEKALDYFTLCLENETDTLSVYYSSSLNEIANIYNLSGKYEEALVFYFRSLKIKEEAAQDSYSQGIAFSYNDISTVYQSMHNYDKAIFYMKKCIEVRENLNENLPSKYYLCIFYSNIANLYTITKQYKKAEDYLQKSLILAKDLNNHYLFEVVYYGYYIYYKATNNPLKALENFEITVLYKDSLNNKEVAKTIADLDKKYQTEKKEAEIIILKKENYIRGLSFVFILVLLIVMVTAAILIIRKQIKIRRTEKILSEKLKKELEYKKKEVLNFSTYVQQRIAFTTDIITNLKKIKSNTKEVEDEINKVISFISLNYQNEQKMINEVYSQIEDINKVFSYRIKKKHNNLTNEDIRLSSLLILNLTSKEIAEILFISPKSVEMKRYRLRKKLKLEKDYSLIDYLTNI